MKKYRLPVLTLLTLLLFVGVPGGLIVRASRQDEANRDLITTIKLHDTEGALAALKAGADPNALDHSQDEPLSFTERAKQIFGRWLHPAVKSDDTYRATALIVHLKDGKQQHPLLVYALLEAGADANLGDSNGTTPIIVATGFGLAGPDRDSMRLLLKYGANVNAKGTDSYTALHVAAYCGDVESVQLLLAHGANVNALEARLNDTPLLSALHMHWSPTVQFLIARSLIDSHTDLNIMNRHGKTALDYARWRQWRQIETLLRQRGARTAQELRAALPASKK